jgi:hypothetical protein
MDEITQPATHPPGSAPLAQSPFLHPLVTAALGLTQTNELPEPGATLFTPVPSVLVRQMAGAVHPLVEQASRYRDFAWSDLEPELIAGRMQLWIAGRPGRLEMACITEVQDRPRAKVGVIVYIAGAHRERWVGFLPLLEQWMREQGCVRIEAWCRRGWERVLTRYRKTHVLMEKPL